MPFTLSDMFGDKKRKQETEATPTKYLAGLKITGSETTKIQIGNQTIEVPSVTYVKILESQIRDLRGLVREQDSTISRLSKSLAKIMNDISTLKLELSKKMNNTFGE